MNIDNLTREEQIQLYLALEKKIGWYGIVILDVEDVKKHIEDCEMPMPSDEAIAETCEYIARNNTESAYPFIEWAAERATEDME
jgi:hypothetical protein